MNADGLSEFQGGFRIAVAENNSGTAMTFNGRYYFLFLRAAEQAFIT